MARYYPNKITTSTVGFNVDLCEQIAQEHGKAKPVPVLRLYGRVKSYNTENSTYGTFLRFVASDFVEGINLVTGDIYRSKTLIVPPGAEMVLAELVDIAKSADEKAVAEFGLDITVQFHKSQNEKGTKFTWGVLPLREPSEDDSITALGKSFGALPKLALADKTKKGKSDK